MQLEEEGNGEERVKRYPAHFLHIAGTSMLGRREAFFMQSSG